MPYPSRPTARTKSITAWRPRISLIFNGAHVETGPINRPLEWEKRIYCNPLPKAVGSGCNGRSWRVSFVPSPETAHAHEMDGQKPGSQIDALPPNHCAATCPTALLFKGSSVFVVRHLASVLHS